MDSRGQDEQRNEGASRGKTRQARHREGINDRGEKIWGRLKNSYLSPETRPISEFKHRLDFRREEIWGRPINLSFRCEGAL